MTADEGRQRIHLLGLGTGHTVGLARILHQRGFAVSGSTSGVTGAVMRLEELGLDVATDAEPKQPSDVDTVVHPPGFGDRASEVAADMEGDVQVVDTGTLLADIVGDLRTIGVTGTHGRATVTSMIAWILECGGWNPGFLVSTRSDNFEVEARDGQGRWFVIELDESLAFHRDLQCDYVVCSYLDLLSPESSGSDDIVATMRRFLEANHRLKEAFVNLDCKGNRELIQKAALRPTGYALQHRTEFRGDVIDENQGDDRGAGKLQFDMFHRDHRLGRFQLSIPGRYNMVNALGAAAVGQRLGVSTDEIAGALESYRGMENRYTVATGGGVTIVKDVVRHPAAIQRVLTTARREVDGRLVAVYALSEGTIGGADADDYAAAFAECDEVVLVPRGDGANVEALADRVRTAGTETVVADEATPTDQIVDRAGPGDKLVFMGNDAFLRIADHVQAGIVSRAGEAPPEEEQQRFDSPLNEGDE